LPGEHSQGVRKGSYQLLPKGDSWGPGIYPSNQPAITGSGPNLKPGQPNSSYRNPALIHEKGRDGVPDSSACVTVNKRIDDIIKEALERNPGSSRIHIREPAEGEVPIRRAIVPPPK
jgi:hypothetical protein